MGRRTGAKDRRVNIRQKTETRDASGQPVATWSDLYSGLWARKLFKSGSERSVNFQRVAEARVVWEIRYAPDITAEMQLVADTIIHDIDAIEEIGRKEALLIYTTARRNPAATTVTTILTAESGDELTAESGDLIITEDS